MRAASRLARLRHPLAAVLGTAGIVVGSVAAMGSPAEAAGDELVGTVSLDCETTVGAKTIPFTWPGAQITLSAVRPAASTLVTVFARVSDMPGVSPVQMMGNPATSELLLSLGGAATTLKGSGSVTNDGPNEPVPVPDLTATLTSNEATLAAQVTSFQLIVSGIVTDCTADESALLGDLTIVEGTPPTPTPTPTTTTSATATPSASASATAPASDEGTPAEGTVKFACVLTIGSTFDYPAEISVSGYREDEGDDVSLVATMSDLPGIAPVLIDGPMDFTLDAEVGGEDVTLTSTGDVTAQPNEAVPVTDLTGEVGAEGDEMEVLIHRFTFDFPSGGVGAECTAKAVSIGTMKVGSEPIEEALPAVSADDPGAASTLPKTGSGDSMPVIALWALALTLLGVAGLLCVPQARGKS